MDNFLRLSNTYLLHLSSLSDFNVVLGNESCDLDSAVCAITYAYLLHTKSGLPAIPVLDITKDELPLKTEVTYFLKENGISLDQLIFRDQLDVETLTNAPVSITLVDHHVLSKYWIPLASKVKTILDHRPLDNNCSWNTSCVKTILNPVGSCATLVAQQFINNDNSEQTHLKVVANLLYGTIVLDTINFSDDAARAKPLDFSMAAAIESALQIRPENILQHRQDLFSRLVRARTDVSGLSPLQLLSRDLKMASNVPVVGLPMLVHNYLLIEDCAAALSEFSTKHKSSIIVLMGIEIKNDIVTRDLALYQHGNRDACSKIADVLLNSKDPLLDLELDACPIDGVTLYKQGNNKASRKFIYPILKHVIQQINL